MSGARRGILSYGAHIPTFRLDREDIRATLGAGGGKGERAVACFDEDTTSMGVEAARHALCDHRPSSVHFATTAPAYADKTNATAIHAALDVDRGVLAADHCGSVRSGYAAMLAASASVGLAVVSDVRYGRPGSADEAMGGDGAAAFLFGSGDDIIAEWVADASITAEFLDRWRRPGDSASQVWEERFGLDAYVPLIVDVAATALGRADLNAVDHIVVVSPHLRAAGTGARALGAATGTIADDLTASIGFAGAAHGGIVLADVLDRANAGETILLIVAADGADAVVLRATDAIARRPAGASVADQIAKGTKVNYPTFLTWRGTLDREPPRRPEPDFPSAPASARETAWKFALKGSRCDACGHMHLPPQRVCTQCQTVDQMTAESLADRRATVLTYTIDHLAYSLSPPVIEVIVEFEGGGRHGCELTEGTADQVAVGRAMEMTFRRMYTAAGIHNYFWKARPASAEGSIEDGQ